MLRNIDPSKFEFEQYTNKYGSPITEKDARERMTDYHYVNDNPLLIRTVDEKYYLPGPDEETDPIKRKLYNWFQWYHDFYNGRHGQKTKVTVRTEDISDPDLQTLIVAMAVSMDFTLQEALYAVAKACSRCRMVLIHKYVPELGGYSDESDEYYESNARCRFCQNDYKHQQQTPANYDVSYSYSQLQQQLLQQRMNDASTNLLTQIMQANNSIRQNMIIDGMTAVYGDNPFPILTFPPEQTSVISHEK